MAMEGLRVEGEEVVAEEAEGSRRRFRSVGAEMRGRLAMV